VLDLVKLKCVTKEKTGGFGREDIELSAVRPWCCYEAVQLRRQFPQCYDPLAHSELNDSFQTGEGKPVHQLGSSKLTHGDGCNLQDRSNMSAPAVHIVY
jgi:hypothetical protein